MFYYRYPPPLQASFLMRHNATMPFQWTESVSLHRWYYSVGEREKQAIKLAIQEGHFLVSKPLLQITLLLIEQYFYLFCIIHLISQLLNLIYFHFMVAPALSYLHVGFSHQNFQYHNLWLQHSQIFI